jgi:hypothetical protein
MKMGQLGEQSAYDSVGDDPPSVLLPLSSRFDPFNASILRHPSCSPVAAATSRDSHPTRRISHSAVLLVRRDPISQWPGVPFLDAGILVADRPSHGV